MIKEGAHKQDQVKIKKMAAAGVSSNDIAKALKINKIVVKKFVKWFEEKGDVKLAEENKRKAAEFTETQKKIKDTEQAIKQKATKMVMNGE